MCGYRPCGDGRLARPCGAKLRRPLLSGQLTAGEASQLENKEAAINREVAKDRAANHGSMIAAGRKQVNRQQNQLSRQIYKDKHNARKR
jgi:hypothetical protein